jgi:hypothetical protein
MVVAMQQQQVATVAGFQLWQQSVVLGLMQYRLAAVWSVAGLDCSTVSGTVVVKRWLQTHPLPKEHFQALQFGDPSPLHRR